MSEGMIIRRGGGGGGFDPTGAVLKVVTSVGCSVNVSGTSYSRTQTDAEGFPRSGDANVVEHFFNIPSTAFGTITVTVSKVYTNGGVSETLTSSKTVSVSTAGKAYEVYVAAANIILDSTFGLQSGYSWIDESAGNSAYSAREKRIIRTSGAGNTKGYLSPNIPVSVFGTLTIDADAIAAGYEINLVDQDNVKICTIDYTGYQSKSISDKYYPDAKFIAEGFGHISKIVLS